MVIVLSSSAGEVVARWMVRSMNPRMAIGASPVHDAVVVAGRRAVADRRHDARVCRGAMLTVVVTLLAEFRCARLQQLRIGRAVRQVAVDAAFDGRRMLPQER